VRQIVFAVLIAAFGLSVFNLRQTQRRDIGERLEQVEKKFLILRGAINRYRLDNDQTPLFPGGIYGGDSLVWLTTPHPYLETWDTTEDPFGGEPMRIISLREPLEKWILVSRGPDRDWDFDKIDEDSVDESVELTDYLAPFEYDPSNGLTSGGDVIRIGS
jgi:hypothetical protein